MRRLVLGGILLSLAVPTTASAQGLRELLSELFVFGSSDEPLFLAGTADPDNPTAVQAHADHFVPSATQGNATLISFLTNAVSANVSNIPISATSSGSTFKFVGGVPVRTSLSPGPIFAERAQTLGKGRVTMGVSWNRFNLEKIRGERLEDLELIFTHVNADFPGCDTIFGGDCTQQGIPGLENDVIQLNLKLDIDVTVTSFFLAYGLLDRVDIAVAIPIVNTRMTGNSIAQVRPFGSTAAHFFAGSPSSPELTASRFVQGSSTGIGDVAARLKINFSNANDRGFSVLADARFPTAAENDLLGSGEYAVRGLGVFSARFGNFSPHANVGYMYRSGSFLKDAVLATVGFDHLMAPWAMLAVELISELQVGENSAELPGTFRFDVPFRRTVEPTRIPNIRDDVVNGSVGFKFQTATGVTLITNTLVPLNDGGVRPDILWTVGLEYNF